MLFRSGFHKLGDSTEVIPELQFNVIAARKDWAAAHKDAVTRLARAFADSFRFLAAPQNRGAVAKLMAETRAYATLLANTVSPRSVAVMKRQLWESQFQSLAEATLQANHEMELSFQTADFKEGVAHFLEKRAARFTGK